MYSSLAINNIEDDYFYEKVYTFSIDLRTQVNVINNSGQSKYPKDTTRRIAFDTLIKWVLQNYQRICQHNENALQTISNKW